MALFLLQCSRIEEWLPFAICYHYCTGPGWELNRSFSLVEVLMPWPIHYPHIDVSPTSGPPTSTPMFDPPGGKAIPHKDSTLLKVHGESLCRWNNLHRAHVCDFFNFSIRTTNRSLAGHWLGKCTSHAAKRTSLNPSIDLLLSPSANALCPYLVPTKQKSSGGIPNVSPACSITIPSAADSRRNEPTASTTLLARFSHLYYAGLPLDLESWDHGLPCSTADSSIRQFWP